MSDVPNLLEGWVDGQPFIVRRGRLAAECANPIEMKFWEWWTVEVSGKQRGARFRASPADTELSVVQQAAVIVRGGARRPPRAL